MKTIIISATALAFSATLGLAQGMPGQHFVENWDIDGDGQVTLAEAQERRGDIFASFDSNDDGTLSADEYVMFDEARAADLAENAPEGRQGAGAMQHAANGLALALNDSNGDGAVSLDEFIGNTARWITAMDRSGDGVITTDDFGR